MLDLPILLTDNNESIMEERKWSRQSFVSGVDQSSLGIPKFTENIVENLTKDFSFRRFIFWENVATL